MSQTQQPEVPEPDYDDDRGPRLPRWLQLAGIVVAILALVIVIAMVVGGPGHTPPITH